MSDLIKREDAIKAVCGICGVPAYTGLDCKDRFEQICTTKEALCNVPAAGKATRWIPVEEQAPKLGCPVLVEHDTIPFIPKNES